ncbi:unnamed protein product [Victoria cruziana]
MIEYSATPPGLKSYRLFRRGILMIGIINLQRSPNIPLLEYGFLWRRIGYSSKHAITELQEMTTIWKSPACGLMSY